MAELDDAVRCKVDLIHEDKSAARCVLHVDHLEQDTRHKDEHGHHAPVLKVRAAIEAAEALRGVPWPWEK